MDNEFKHDNHTIIRETNLPYSFLKRCNAELPILDRFREKKDKNKIHYNDNGLIVWREIRKLFEQGKTMAQIRAHLESTIETSETRQEIIKESNGIIQESRNPDSSRGEAHQHSNTALWIDAFQKQADSALLGWQKAAAALEREVQGVRDDNAELERRLLALPDGRTPEEIASELERTHEQEKELGAIKAEQEAKARRADELKSLLAHYETLKGWGKRKERARVWDQIKSIQL